MERDGRDAAAKNDKFPYDPLRQNSNTLADSVLHDAGLRGPQNDGLTGHLAPASHLALDKKLVPRDPGQQALAANLSDLVSADRPVEADVAAQLEKQKAGQRMHALTESPLFKQAQTAMQKLDTQYGPTSDQSTDNAAAAVAVAAQHAGMTRIDHLEAHGDKLIAVQGTPGTAHSKVVNVPAVQALNTPITESAETFAQQAPQTAPRPVQQQELAQQHAQPAPVMGM